MSVLENFEQRISEAQSNKDCEGIISDICSSTKLHNKDRRELLEKIISSPKFEKPSKKLCAEFYTALTEMYNDGVLELIYNLIVNEKMLTHFRESVIVISLSNIRFRIEGLLSNIYSIIVSCNFQRLRFISKHI